MAVLINKNTKVIIQGITGNQGSFHARLMLNYGTKIVAGVTPGKGGEKVENVPVFNSVRDALKGYKADFSIIFVPARFVKGAALEALQNSLNLVIITEGVPVHDVLEIVQEAEKRGLVVVGPNCPGIITPEECKLGIMPSHIFRKGKVGVISRSGTLTYEIVNELTRNSLGQSTVIGVGGDPVAGLNFVDALKLFEKDRETEKIVLIGEIGGDLEERAAEYIKKDIKKKVVAYIAGRTAPEGKKMGHAGAVISGKSGTAKTKIEALKKAGVEVAELPSKIVELLQ